MTIGWRDYGRTSGCDCSDCLNPLHILCPWDAVGPDREPPGYGRAATPRGASVASIHPGTLCCVTSFEFRFVKLPVTDLVRSASWYRDLLDLRRQFEFAEHGEVRGVQLVDATGEVTIALRDRRYCADHPRLAGFDVVSFRVESRDALVELAARCDRLGARYTTIQDLPPFVSTLDVHDPDDTVLRFAFDHPTAPTEFVGVDIGDAGPSLYRDPRLDY